MMTRDGPRLPAMLVLAAAVLMGSAAAAADIRVAGVELRTPPDSHEPQRARVVLRNDGPSVRAVGIACTFADETGKALERVEAQIPALAPGAERAAEPIYYGWPRASRVACAVVPQP